MMIQMDTENAKSMAAACRSFAGELEKLPAALGPLEQSGSTAALLPILPLLTITRSANRVLLIAGVLRGLARKLDTIPATAQEMDAALISDKAYAELMALFDPLR